MPDKKFYLRDGNACARELLGKLLVHSTPHGDISGMIVEVESYMGANDAGAHTYGNIRSKRTQVQYLDGGIAYIYLIYGMYNCFNVVANIAEKPEAILVRALQPVDGIELMKEQRRAKDEISLCNGPGKLCQALSITREQNGFDLCTSQLRIEDYSQFDDSEICVSPRINIDYAGEAKDYLWRFFVKNDKHVSKHRNNSLALPYSRTQIVLPQGDVGLCPNPRPF